MSQNALSVGFLVLKESKWHVRYNKCCSGHDSCGGAHAICQPTETDILVHPDNLRDGEGNRIGYQEGQSVHFVVQPNYGMDIYDNQWGGIDYFPVAVLQPAPVKKRSFFGVMFSYFGNARLINTPAFVGGIVVFLMLCQQCTKDVKKLEKHPVKISIKL